jgi:hypothetical protein
MKRKLQVTPTTPLDKRPSLSTYSSNIKNNGCIMLDTLSYELICCIFEKMWHRDALRLASTCLSLWVMFKETGSFWKEYLLYDIHLCQKRYGVRLTQISYYWECNINPQVTYRDCWEDMKLQRIFIVVCRSPNKDQVAKSLHFVTEDQEELSIVTEMESCGGMDPCKIICIGPTKDILISFLIINELIGSKTKLLTEKMKTVYTNHKLEFIFDKTLDKHQHVWTDAFFITLLMDVTALIAIAEYFSLPYSAPTRMFQPPFDFIKPLLRQARQLATKYQKEIWKAFNLADVQPRRLLVAPFPENFNAIYEKPKHM